jgi:adenylate cyclase
MGFAEVPDGEVRFTEADLDAARTLGRLKDTGTLPADVREAVARAMAQSTSQLAEWQVGMLKRLIESQGEQPDPQQSAEIALTLLPALEQLQTYVWRRHLAATVARMLVNAGPSGADDTTTLTVGFADMVGFTRTTRRRSVAELSELIERFGAATSEIIAEGSGRIVKTVGDEVLFVADDPAAGAAIALGVQDRVRQEPVLPPLRIGLAAGPVLMRYGDVFGEVVNIAARLTGNAHADSILVDREVAQALAGDDRFVLKAVRAVSVRGYRRLHPWALERAG